MLEASAGSLKHPIQDQRLRCFDGVLARDTGSNDIQKTILMEGGGWAADRRGRLKRELKSLEVRHLWHMLPRQLYDEKNCNQGGGGGGGGGFGAISLLLRSTNL